MFSINEIYEEVCTSNMSEEERRLTWNWFTEIDERRVSEADHLSWYLNDPHIITNIKRRLCEKIYEKSERETIKDAFLTSIVGSPNEYAARVGEFTNRIRNDYLKKSIIHLILSISGIVFFILLKISVGYSYAQGDTFTHPGVISFFGYLIPIMAVIFFIIGIIKLYYSNPENCKKLAEDKVQAMIGKKAMECLRALAEEGDEICKINTIISNYKITNPPDQQTASE